MSTVSKYRYDEKGQCASAGAASEQRGTEYAVIGIVCTRAFWASRKEQSAHRHETMGTAGRATCFRTVSSAQDVAHMHGRHLHSSAQNPKLPAMCMAWRLGSAVHTVMTNLKRANDAPPRRRPAGALRPGRLAFPAPLPAAAPVRGELEITSK